MSAVTGYAVGGQGHSRTGRDKRKVASLIMTTLLTATAETGTAEPLPEGNPEGTRHEQARGGGGNGLDVITSVPFSSKSTSYLRPAFRKRDMTGKIAL